MTRLLAQSFALIVLLTQTSTSFSQSPERTHRVIELEEKLQKDAITFLSNRFPGQPFSVAITVNPLRRILLNYNLKGEQLPYFAIEEEGIKDEWDDPTVSLFTLLDRVKSIEVNLQIPEGLSELEQSEMKEGIVRRLRLIPARDPINISQKRWQSRDIDWIGWALGVGLLIIGLLGLLAIFRTSAKKVADSLSSIQNKLGTSSNPAPPPPPRPLIPKANSSSESAGDMNVHDPIKTRELLRQRVIELSQENDFFSISNILYLDEFGKKNPSSLGALLVQFSIEQQKKIFAFSKGRHWMQAFYQPGDVQPSCLRLAEKLHRASAREYCLEREELLIQLWRLDDQRVPFLKSIPQEEALSLLADLPKYLSIPAAREAFPGSWAPILQSDFRPLTISPERLSSLLEMSLQLKPLSSFSLIDVFKRDQELLQFAQTASLTEEKEIYQSLPKDSLLWEIRPPFYLIFDQPPELIQQLVAERPPHEWAHILFNVTHEDRRKIDCFIEGKFRFLYLETLKQLDKSARNSAFTFDLRTEVGLRIQQLKDLAAACEPDSIEGLSASVESQLSDDSEAMQDVA